MGEKNNSVLKLILEITALFNTCNRSHNIVNISPVKQSCVNFSIVGPSFWKDIL